NDPRPDALVHRAPAWLGYRSKDRISAKSASYSAASVLCEDFVSWFTYSFQRLRICWMIGGAESGEKVVPMPSPQAFPSWTVNHALILCPSPLRYVRRTKRF